MSSRAEGRCGAHRAAGLLGSPAARLVLGRRDVRRSDGKLIVVTSFYPLAYLAERIGGDRVSVTNLASGGVEPHDLELTPKDVAADRPGRPRGLPLRLPGRGRRRRRGRRPPDSSFDAATAADLSLTYTPIEDGAVVAGQAGAVDPHFWLDPSRLRRRRQALAARLGTIDPTDAATFTANAKALRCRAGGPRLRLEDGDRDLRQPRAGDEPQRLRLPRPAVRLHPARHHRAQPGGRALTEGPRGQPSTSSARTTSRRSTTRRS